MSDGPRIVVVGTSGAGKTTLAGRVARPAGDRARGDRRAVPRARVDAPGGVPPPTCERSPHETPGSPNGSTPTRPLLIGRAPLVVWLDYPLALRMSRVVRRTVSRRLRRTRLWNGNVESSLWRALTDPEGIIRWAWSTRHAYDDLPALLAAAGAAELPVVRLRSPSEAEGWLAELAAAELRG